MSTNPLTLNNNNQYQLSSNNGIKNLFKPANLAQTLTIILNSSLIFKSFCISIIIGYLFSFKNDINQFITVVPGKLLPPNFYLWTLLTHSFVEFRLIQVIFDWFLILLYSKMLEPLWGQIECIQFFFITTISVAVSTAFIYFISYAVTFNELLLFNININGLGALLGGFSVAIKQIMPDTVLVDVSFIRLKQNNIPLLLVLTSLLIYLIGLTSLTYFIMVTLGVFYSWVYLRFFQKHKNGTRGDSSSTFVFASFFPSQIQPFVAIISNTIFNLLVRIKICKQPPKRYNLNSASGTNSTNSIGSQSSHITITIPMVKNLDNSDAERRRLKALKALKERLKKPGEEDDLKSQWSDTTNLIDTPILEVNETATTTTTSTTSTTNEQNNQTVEIKNEQNTVS